MILYLGRDVYIYGFIFSFAERKKDLIIKESTVRALLRIILKQFTRGKSPIGIWFQSVFIVSYLIFASEAGSLAEKKLLNSSYCRRIGDACREMYMREFWLIFFSIFFFRNDNPH